MEYAADDRVVLDVFLAGVDFCGWWGGVEGCEDVGKEDAVCQEVDELVDISRRMGWRRGARRDDRGRRICA